ncbi:MAG: MaoC/PaaZ C-terminal domain-containing protein [Gemmatimonadaceae bacterium]
MTSASFEVGVTAEDAIAFATLSGDWNPLHTNADHAVRTAYRRPVLHGAFSAGLISRMAGMYLPGADCLLHAMRLRFAAPIIPPAMLVVSGRQLSESGSLGRVDVTISDAATGTRYVDAVYEFSRHEVAAPKAAAHTENPPVRTTAALAPTFSSPAPPEDSDVLYSPGWAAARAVYRGHRSPVW